MCGGVSVCCVLSEGQKGVLYVWGLCVVLCERGVVCSVSEEATQRNEHCCVFYMMFVYVYD